MLLIYLISFGFSVFLHVTKEMPYLAHTYHKRTLEVVQMKTYNTGGSYDMEKYSDDKELCSKVQIVNMADNIKLF